MCIDAGLEIAKCFDVELNAGALKQHFNRNIKPNVKLIQEARARGENPIGVTMVENVRTGQPGKRQTDSYFPSYALHVFLLSSCFVYFISSAHHDIDDSWRSC